MFLNPAGECVINSLFEVSATPSAMPPRPSDDTVLIFPLGKWMVNGRCKGTVIIERFVCVILLLQRRMSRLLLLLQCWLAPVYCYFRPWACEAASVKLTD